MKRFPTPGRVTNKVQPKATIVIIKGGETESHSYSNATDYCKYFMLSLLSLIHNTKK